MKKILLIVLLMWGVQRLSAQETAQTGSLIQGGIADGNKLVKAYMLPLDKAIIFSLGQYNYAGFTGADERKFSMGLKTVFLVAPAAERQYNINKLGLETLEAEDPNSPMAATILGDSLQVNTLVSKKKDLLGRPLVKLHTPAGSGYPGFPVPALDFQYRTPVWNFDFGAIPLTPVPTTDLKIFMLRLGAQYNLASRLGFIDAAKYEWSAGISYAFFHGFAKLNVDPEDVTVMDVYLQGHQHGPYDNQRLLLDYHSFSFSTHYAYKWGKHWKVFAGLGAVYGFSHLQLKGKYPIYTTDPFGAVSITAEDVEDPLDIQGNYGQFFAEAGLRGDWKRWYLQFQANAGHYNGLALNVGYKLW